VFDKIPYYTTILLTHGPAMGLGGWTSRSIEAGSLNLRMTVDNLPDLRFHAFGHIHEGFGDYERYPDGKYVLHSNVSLVDLFYRPRPLKDAIRVYEF
jgi:hypothetical protein